MKIFSAQQIKQWDAYTIACEPISSIDLMERASTACCNWLLGKNFGGYHFRIFCGKGNNGGDGLALARMLIQHQCHVTVYIPEFGKSGTADFQINLEKLHQCTTDIHFIQSAEFFPAMAGTDIVIDALFGTGINKPLDGLYKELVEHINQNSSVVISIDLPSGLLPDSSSKATTVIRATHTLSFQNHKLAFLLPENEAYCGQVHLLHIGLHPDFENNEPAVFEWVDEAFIRPFVKTRDAFAHKGTYGHAQLICGSRGMMGAAILSARACLRSGAGKVTCLVPGCGYEILQSAVPEAMCVTRGDDFISSAADPEKYNAIGIGPGIGLHASHKELLMDVFKKSNAPLVIDADALNTISQHKELLNAIPSGSILTPHPAEFARLFGHSANDFDRLNKAMKHSKEYNIHIILKGHFSFISTPHEKGYFNSTGNPGMATGGSGDVLTGILTGLLARGYPPLEAALLGAYLHGSAGDIAAARYSQEAMIAGDIVSCLPDACIQLSSIPQ